MTRRDFLKGAAAAPLAPLVVAAPSAGWRVVPGYERLTEERMKLVREMVRAGDLKAA